MAIKRRQSTIQTKSIEQNEGKNKIKNKCSSAKCDLQGVKHQKTDCEISGGWATPILEKCSQKKNKKKIFK